MLKIPKIEPIGKNKVVVKIKERISDTKVVADFASIGGILEEKSKTENLKKNQNLDSIPEEWRGKNGGPRPGAGRPEGKLGPKKIEEKNAMKYIRERVVSNIEPLVNTQLNLARGVTYLYKVVETGKGEKKKRETIRVTDEWEIKNYLDGVYENEIDGAYYYITTKPADNKALDSLLDRVFGRAKQTIDLGVTETLEDILLERKKLREEYEKSS